MKDWSDPGYMHWAKTHPRARFELTGSGVSAVSADDLAADPEDLDLEVRGTYGDPDLIAAIASLRDVPADRVVPLLGTSTANFVALGCAARPGETVLVETPVYDPLVRAAEFLGLRVLSFARRADAGFRPDLDAVAAGLAGGARAVLLTNLHNPSGLACPPEDLVALGELAASHGACLIVDEVYLDYARINAGANPDSAVGLGDSVIVTDSLTKVYGLGPLRAGWLIARPDLAERARMILDLLNVVNPPVSARLAIRALSRLAQLGHRCQVVYRQTWPIFVAWLQQRSDVSGYGNQGALFAWLRLSSGVSPGRLADLLAAEYETAVTPGTFFGCPDHLRVGFGLPPDELREGLTRLGAALDRLRP